MDIFYYVIDSTISKASQDKIAADATTEFAKLLPNNILSIATNPLHNEDYLKIVTDENGDYIKQTVQAELDGMNIKSIHRDNSSFIGKLIEYWETLPQAL